MIADEILDRARETVARNLARTPLLPYHAAGLEVPVYLKYEGAQPTGSFKVRGGVAALTAYAAEGVPVVTASAGNHALGIAHASRLLGAKSTVVVPEGGSPAKIAALRTYPVELVLAPGGYDGAEAKALELAAGGRKFVSAYNDPHVIGGQSTLVGEVAETLGEDFTIVVPTGAGGLLAGTALGARRARPDVRVLGVESAACHAVSAAVAAGHVVTVPVGDTIADGLVGNLEPESITPAIVREAGVRLVDVDEAAIRRSVRELALTAGLVAEGSSAAALAALRAGLVPADRPVVLVVSGRNIAAGLLATILTEG
ncbi:threonine/serine dehydratase [Amycolatopsis sp. FDAARGOS 1241]|uniref:threonine ammonia-lyase n=1 Tax=Amycolatopsis sp. FDAARGOS 1241 TaxID=2778070 RepID=UPI00194FB0B3|nr:pyridoxal-phosphate dependent enzyme [Amycolatopsis sp. FDAARGOS 1241]QRP43330.1 pyridoxal-phosphate dependent enzyme [Amycolatopsis sp. FDAARGOS 1241]